MCKCKKGMHGVGMAMPEMNTPDWGHLAATVLGAAASNVVVNPIVNKLFEKKSDDERKTYSAYVKLGLGIGGIMFAPNEYLVDAALGIAIDGGAELLRSKVPQLKPLAKKVDGVGQVIDLSNVNWRQLNGIETDFSVGNLEGNLQGSSVSGGVN
jgi:hypothetical protein